MGEDSSFSKVPADDLEYAKKQLIKARIGLNRVTNEEDTSEGPETEESPSTLVSSC